MHNDPVAALDITTRAAGFVRAVRQALGDAQFAQLCATLGGADDHDVVQRALQGVP